MHMTKWVLYNVWPGEPVGGKQMGNYDKMYLLKYLVSRQIIVDPKK